MFHIYRYAVGRESPRPAGDLLLMRTAAWKSLAISFAARTQVGKAIFASFCLLTKGRGCPVSGKGGAAGYRQTYSHKFWAWFGRAARTSSPLCRCPRPLPFFRREKGSKTRCSPAPSGLRLTAPPTAPNGLRGSLLFLIRPGAGEWFLR